MAKQYAVRNLRLCTKDCICLYVCPTGATDTENSIIDIKKCIGCGACANACPSKAISLVPYDYPKAQKKEKDVKDALRNIINSKNDQELIADKIPNRLAKAIAKSSRIMADDLKREAGFMIAQNGNTLEFLESIKDYPDIPKDVVDRLLRNIRFNEELEKKENEVWQCSVCGYIHYGPLPEDFTCPICNHPASVFEKL